MSSPRWGNPERAEESRRQWRRERAEEARRDAIRAYKEQLRDTNPEQLLNPLEAADYLFRGRDSF